MAVATRIGSLVGLLGLVCALSALDAAGGIVVTTFVGKPRSYGPADGIGPAAQFSYPAQLALDAHGDLYVADTYNFTIRKVTSEGAVTTLAGKPGAGGYAEGAGTAAAFQFVIGIAVAADGSVYVGDGGNFLLRRITPAGLTSTLAGRATQFGAAFRNGAAARLGNLSGLAVDRASGDIYACDAANHVILRVSPAGAVSLVAGKAGTAGNRDGAGTAATFNFPGALAIDAKRNLYVADSGGDTVRKLTPAGIVTTIAGSPGVAGSADGIGAAARFDLPCGIAVDADGTVYVADGHNHTIRRIAPDGSVTTLAGKPGEAGSADGDGSTARFKGPGGIAVARDGSLFVCDSQNSTIRRIAAAAAPRP